MSKKIDRILDVLEIVQRKYTISDTTNIQALRIDATTEVAERLELWRTTVLDKYQRGLEPDIYGTDAFDTLVRLWVEKGVLELHDILLRHSSDDQDRQNIEKFFNKDVLLGENLYQKMQRLTKVAESGIEYEVDFNPESLDDERRMVARELVQRQGQVEFRRLLLEIYENKCCMTGTSVVEVLEAAHISPYRGKKSNHPTNGLLLRADIHTLFDYGLISIHETDYTILVSSIVEDAQYRDLHTQRILLPQNHDFWPNKVYLEKHRIASKIALS